MYGSYYQFPKRSFSKGDFKTFIFLQDFLPVHLYLC